jgi:hypothetical protein
MFTITLITAIALLASLWLYQWAVARPQSDAANAALHAQLDSMIADMDADERQFAKEDREYCREIGQSARQSNPSKTTTTPKPRKPKPTASSPPMNQPPLNTPSIVAPSGASAPTENRTPSGFSSVNCSLSIVNSPSLSASSATPRGPFPPLPKKTLWPTAVLSFCKKAAITTILRPLQLATRTFFSLFARNKPSRAAARIDQAFPRGLT